ncbi:MAG: glycosyltransferase [Chloroflexi bacterium]|nr:glycosyltransferase [Chloroflexota bacterium]
MHAECFAWVRNTIEQLPARRRVVEIGGRNINGSVRPLFAGAEYTAVDVAPGAGVDVVEDGATYQPEAPPDTVVCCEVLEHAPNAEQIVANAVRILAPGGLLILTCATDPRPPHSGHDGGGLQAGEHYRNVPMADVERWLRAAGVETVRGHVDTQRGDLMVEAWKSGRSQQENLRLLLVHPGADWSTADVFDGYRAALLDLGHTAAAFNLHVRLARADAWLTWNWRRAGKPDPKPSRGDVYYLAGCDVVSAALQGNVDWVVIFTGSYLHPDTLVQLRRAGRRVALVLTESPYEDDWQRRIIPYADVVFTNERASVNALRTTTPNVYYLPHAYDPARHRPDLADDPDVPAHDVVFVGTGFPERLEALAAVDWTGIDLGLYGTYELLGSRSKLRQYVRDGVIDNARAAALYRKAKIGLNLYRQSVTCHRESPRILGAQSMNPRAFELAACGAFQISDARAEVAEVFGGLVPTFTDPAELGALVRRWLADDAGRAAIRAAVPERIARSTFAHRAAQVAAFLAAIQSEMAATVRRGA